MAFFTVPLLLKAFAVAATVASVSEQRQAGKAQRRGQKLAQRRADIQASRERREQVRQARIKRAEILQESANTGAAGSSSEAGAIGSLQAQLGERLGTGLLFQDISQGQSRANISASRSGTRANIFGTAGNLATSFIRP